MSEENPKGLVDAQNKKDELVLAMKEVDLKLAENKERKRPQYAFIKPDR